MKILFIGGNGNISWNCAVQALQKGYEVWALNRDSGSLMRREMPKGVCKLKADVWEPGSVERALKGLKFDVVADFICFTPEQAKRSLEIYSGICKQFIFISTASAYQKPLVAVPITESTPLKNPHWLYSRNKIACEELFFNEYREKDFPITVVRPSHTYDTIIPAAMGSSGWTNSARMLAGKPIILHGDGTTLWTLTHAEDFAKAFTALLGNPSAIGHAFHITSDEWLTWRQISEDVAEALGAPKPSFICVPSEKIAEKNPDLGAGLLGDKSWCGIFDNSKIKKTALGWQAQIPFREGIKRTLSWFMENAERRKINAELDAFLDTFG
ncbi:MAG: NAD-dependent epimerase/dehydratase family protein [Fibromonadaceae bacterium]|jgi:nucleoside-diphosphate-sugar epimerase|nr:NAD-dependent epimerase/dehydratase family protein [Fibromonadaceae bacterium]